MTYAQALSTRQKIATLGRFIKASAVCFLEWVRLWFDNLWVGSQQDLAVQERFDALEEKDRQIRALKEWLDRERRLTTELSQDITSMGLRLMQAEDLLNGKDLEIEHLRADVASLRAERNDMLGGRKRKRP